MANSIAYYIGNKYAFGPDYFVFIGAGMEEVNPLIPIPLF